MSGTGQIKAYANIQSNSSGADCTGRNIGFSRTGGSTINVFADDATCRAVGEIQEPGQRLDDVHGRREFVRAAGPAAQSAGATEARSCASHGQGWPHRPSTEVVPRSTGAQAPREDQTQPCDVGGNGASYRDLDWILYPGLYPAGLNVSTGTTAYLMPGIYWIGGGGMRISNGGSLISIANVADANTNPALATWGGGVMIYNTSLPTATAGDI